MSSSFYTDHPSPSSIYTLSLHDALPICGTKRMTVPARPVSISIGSAGRCEGSGSGVTCSSASSKRRVAPSRSRASAIRRVSRETSAPRRREGSSAIAARSIHRAVKDFEPGTCTTASTGFWATGAAHSTSEAVKSSTPLRGELLLRRVHGAPGLLPELLGLLLELALLTLRLLL